MSFKDIWRPRIDGVDDADSSAVNEIAEAVINNENFINNAPNKYYNKESVNNLFANALKGSASGEAVALKDVSPLEHILGVKVSSKNLLGEPYMFNKVSYENGVYTQTAADSRDIIRFALMLRKNDANTNISFCKQIEKRLGKHTLTFTIESDDLMDSVWFGLSGQSLNNYAYYHLYLPKGIYMISWEMLNVTQGEIAWTNIQIEKGTTASPYTPPISDLSAVKLLVQGANLLSLDKIIDLSNCSIENGVVTQTEADASPIPYLKAVATLDSGEYELMGKSEAVTASGKVSFQITCAQEINKLAFGFNGSVMDTMVRFDNLSLPAGTYIASCNVINATQGSISWKDMQIALVDTDYEPYKEPIEYVHGEDIKSIYPTTTIMTDTEGAIMTVEYNKDANKVVKSLEDRISALEAMIVSQ